jgi:predicted phosphoadenosine phosphosulfate sulfurtransferase
MAGRQKGKKVGMQPDSRMYRKTDVKVYIQTYRNKDVQTYTDRQTVQQDLSNKKTHSSLKHICSAL